MAPKAKPYHVVTRGNTIGIFLSLAEAQASNFNVKSCETLQQAIAYLKKNRIDPHFALYPSLFSVMSTKEQIEFGRLPSVNAEEHFIAAISSRLQASPARGERRAPPPQSDAEKSRDIEGSASHQRRARDSPSNASPSSGVDEPSGAQGARTGSGAPPQISSPSPSPKTSPPSSPPHHFKRSKTIQPSPSLSGSKPPQKIAHQMLKYLAGVFNSQMHTSEKSFDFLDLSSPQTHLLPSHTISSPPRNKLKFALTP